MGFFDSISRAIGTDGSGGGALVEVGKFIEQAAPKLEKAISDDPAAIIFGPAFSNNTQTRDTALALGAVAITGGMATGAIPGGATFLSTATTAANTGAKIIGGLNALQLASSRPSANTGPIPLRPNTERIDYGLNGAPVDSEKSEKTVGAIAIDSAGVSKPKDSTLTILASGLTVMAIIYQFAKEK